MDRTAPPPSFWIAGLHYGLYCVLVVLVLSKVVAPALGEEKFGYSNGNIRDFAGIFVMAKAMWFGEPQTATGERPGYCEESHLAVTRAWLGRDIDAAMPFPHSPTTLYLLGPICPLPMAWAFAVWSVVNLAVVGWVVAQKDCPRVLGPVIFLTPKALACFDLGQSALLATAALVYLGGGATGKTTGRAANLWVMAAMLWALTARPQLAITASVALLAVRQFRPVLIAVALTVVTTAIATALLGPRWMTDYINLLSRYDLVTAPEAYKWALVPSHMNNLRALLTMVFGVRDDWSARISTVVWLLSLAAVLVSGWVRRMPAPVAWGTCVVLQLLLCPHVNSYELILLYAVVVFFLHVESLPNALRMTAGWFVPLLLWLPPVGGPFGERPSFLFFGLLIVGGVFVWLFVRRLSAAPGPESAFPADS